MSECARILIVDDEPNVRLMFRTVLDAVGYATDEAGDGESALALQRSRPADLILLDLRMPGLDGMETLARLRESGDPAPVAMITAHGSIPDAVAAMKLGAIDFLSKPLTPEALRDLVADVLARRPAPGPAPSRTPAVVEGRSSEDLRLAKGALNLRDFDRAEALLLGALRADPRSAEAHNLLGVLHEVRGRREASYHSYRAALRADRQYQPSQHNIRRFYEEKTFGGSDVPIDLGD